MSIIVWILFGALVGWIASIMTRTDESQGVIGNIVVGILGAILGGYLSRFLGWDGVTGFNLGSFVISLFGAILLLMLVRAVTSKGGRGEHL
jgi:uncharacterized membrane protein YeaQ/YmgE (transglycosylase-associated protein family)